MSIWVSDSMVLPTAAPTHNFSTAPSADDTRRCPVAAEQRQADPRAHNLEALARIADVDVVVIFPGSDDVHAPPNVELRSFQTVPRRPTSRSRAGLRLFSGRPWRLANQDWASAEQVIGNLDPGPFDLVWFGLVDHAYALGPAVRARRSIVDLDDIETDKIHSQLAMPTDMDGTTRAERTQRRIELPMWARIERLTVRSADRVPCAASAIESCWTRPTSRSSPIPTRNRHPRSPVGEITPTTSSWWRTTTMNPTSTGGVHGPRGTA